MSYFILQDWLCFNYTSTRAQSALHKAEYFFVLASVAALLVRHCHLGCRRPQPQARHRPSQGNGTLTLTWFCEIVANASCILFLWQFPEQRKSGCNEVVMRRRAHGTFAYRFITHPRFWTSADLVKKRQKSLRVEEFRINVRTAYIHATLLVLLLFITTS